MPLVLYLQFGDGRLTTGPVAEFSSPYISLYDLEQGRDRLGHDDDQLVHVGHRRALELILSGAESVQRAAPVFQRGKQHPVTHQRGHLLMAELPPPPAGEQLSPVVHAEGF